MTSTIWPISPDYKAIYSAVNQPTMPSTSMPTRTHGEKSLAIAAFSEEMALAGLLQAQKQGFDVPPDMFARTRNILLLSYSAGGMDNPAMTLQLAEQQIAQRVSIVPEQTTGEVVLPSSILPVSSDYKVIYTAVNEPTMPSASIPTTTHAEKSMSISTFAQEMALASLIHARNQNQAVPDQLLTEVRQNLVQMYAAAGFPEPTTALHSTEEQVTERLAIDRANSQSR